TASDNLPSASADERAGILAEMKTLKEGLREEEAAHEAVIKEWRELMLQVPNVPDATVPDGDVEANQEVSTWGKVPKFKFEPKSHHELALSLGIADFEAGARLSGFRGYVLLGFGARLQMAVVNLALDRLLAKGFEPMVVPSLVRRETLLGTGYLPQGEDDLYRTQDGEYLAGTAEVAAMSYFADAALAKSSLPRKIVAFSPCFRREAGSHGKDEKGLFRVHEFVKLEQVVIAEARHEESVRLHEELRENAEEILQALELPYHVIVNASGDLGLGQVKKYDLEAWMPSEKRYRETHSASYFHDFQTRRLNIKYIEDDGTPNGKRVLAHSLNNTAIASPRILCQLLEVHQQADGSVKIPEALRPYLGGAEEIRPHG
ncbi:MAG TPA: serine--tRNA ligase, partial [Candidatus Paceibacterota bacterium]